MSQDVEDGDRHTGSVTVGVGLLAGVAIGAALGLLLAPRKGSELRGQLAESAHKARESVQGVYQQAAGAAGQVGEVAARAATDVGRSVRKLVGAGRG